MWYKKPCGGEAEIEYLLSHFGTLFEYLGGNKAVVDREWMRLKMHIMRDKNLCALPYSELWERMFDHESVKSNPLHFFNVLLLVAIVHDGDFGHGDRRSAEGALLPRARA